MLLVNICLCMTTYYLLFIFGINNPVKSSEACVSEQNVIPSSDLEENVDQGPCTAITALLQYFLLATFAWNILYAAHVFFLIRNALNGPPRAFRTIAMTVGWGTFNHTDIKSHDSVILFAYLVNKEYMVLNSLYLIVNFWLILISCYSMLILKFYTI